MKSNTLPLFCLFLLIAINGVAQSNQHALLIAVGDYPTTSGWGKLHSTNDIALLQSTLERQGFSPNHITTLKNEQATKIQILQAIDQELTQKVKKGGMAVFHFSGHGQQVIDNNGDELDGLDEALVPIDSPQKFQKGIYEGENLLRDEELGDALMNVRKKLGKKGHLLVLIDACHSGTGTRAYLTARGTDIIMAEESYMASLEERDEAITFLTEDTEAAKNYAPMVALFSSGAQQLSFEDEGEDGKQYGVFSHAFCTALTAAKADFTYGQLLEKIRLKVNSSVTRQTPQAEGDLNTLIFGSGKKTLPISFDIIQRFSSNMLLVDAGLLRGFTPGSRIVLYPRSVTDTIGLRPLAEGTVDLATAFNADVILDRPIEKAVLAQSKVFLRAHNYKNLSVKINLAFSDKQLATEMEHYLKDYAFIEVVDSNVDLIVETTSAFAGAAEMNLYQKDNQLLWTEKLETKEKMEQIYYHLVKIASQYARARFLRTLEVDDGVHQPQIKLLVKNDKGEFYPLQGNQIPVGTIVKMEIINQGAVGFYYRLIDLQPDHVMNTVLPNDKYLAADCYLKAGEKRVFEFELEVQPPYGLEMLKIIATAEPLDLNFARGGSNNLAKPLEILLGTVIELENSRGEMPTVSNSAGTIASLAFEIVK